LPETVRTNTILASSRIVVLVDSFRITASPAILVSEGPQGMVRGALIYGGMVYFLSRKKTPFDFREQLLGS
jgi:hypothetical protein